MTTAEVVATLASPLNAFKIINTGATIGAFNEDRDAAIRGVFGARARMIPVHIRVHRGRARRDKLNVEVLDLPSLTPQAVLVTLYESLLESNDSTAETSYHLTGSIDLEGYPPSPLDLWAPAGEAMPAPMETALLAGEQFSRLYSNCRPARRGARGRSRCGSHSAARRGGVGGGAAGFQQHCSCRRHGGGGGDAAGRGIRRRAMCGSR